jgi:glycosyltransferase involved in cell wall biosynthesis/predicted O-methyltransferase YrrM
MTGDRRTPLELVSCLMPTYQRRAFVPLAIAGFLRQDYPERELVILDDGDDPVADLVPDEPRIRYQRLPNRITLGMKRNMACAAARGSLLAHWDDDDWYAPNRISVQVHALRTAGADVCGVRSLLFYDPVAEAAWRYRYPDGGRAWVTGSSMCFTREFWERNPFDAVACGEDTRLLWRSRSCRIVALDEPAMVVATLHGHNTSRTVPKGARWQPVQVSEVTAVLGSRAAAYRAAARDPMAAALPPAIGPQHVTVSVPYFRCREYLATAVESLLAQTHRDLTVVVVNDGDPESPWPLLAHLDDPRLVRFDLDRNRGRYFADAVVLAATGSPWFAPHDADDWSEPERLATLLRRLRETHAAAVFGGYLEHQAGWRAPRPVCADLMREPLAAQLTHRAMHFGLYDVAALRATGGYYAGFRVGFDTLLVNLMQMTGPVAFVDRPLYHRRIRPGSLTSASATGMHSAHRREVKARLARMYAEALPHHRAHLAGEIDRAELRQRVQLIVGRDVTEEERESIRRQADRLAASLREPRPALAVAAPRPTVRVDDVLADEELWRDNWTLDRTVAVELAARLAARKPGAVLEVGSGSSTLLLAAYAAASGARLVTLEHDARFAARTAALLDQTGLRRHVQLVTAPLKPLACADGATHRWYETQLDGPFDFVLIDGPPGRFGREAAMFAVAGRLAADWEAWLNDGHRAGERHCAELWQQHLEVRAHLRPAGDGVWVLRPAARPAAPPAGLPARAVSSVLLFWSALDIKNLTPQRRNADWVDDRFRHWLTFTLPSILGQERADFRYWLVCDPAARTLTEPLRDCIRDRRVELVYADECAERLRRLPRSDRYLVSRIDSDDLYHPKVGTDLTRHPTTSEFLQFNRGLAGDVDTGEVRRWESRSSPFYTHVYGPELRDLDTWREPDHTTVRSQATILDPDRFLVALHARNTSSSIRAGRDRLPADAAAEALRTFGLGAVVPFEEFCTRARAPGEWATRPAVLDHDLRNHPDVTPERRRLAQLVALICRMTAARRILDLGAGIGSVAARAYAAGNPGTVCHAVARNPARREELRRYLTISGLPAEGVTTWPDYDAAGEPRYDLVVGTPAWKVPAALNAVLPTGLVLLHGPPDPAVARTLARYCADTVTTGDREVLLLARVLGPLPP